MHAKVTCRSAVGGGSKCLNRVAPGCPEVQNPRTINRQAQRRAACKLDPKLHHPGVTSESSIIRKYSQAHPGSNFASARHTVWNLGAGGRRVRKFAAAAQRAATCNEARRSRIPIPCRQAQLRAACKGACVSKPYQFSSVQLFKDMHAKGTSNGATGSGAKFSNRLALGARRSRNPASFVTKHNVEPPVKIQRVRIFGPERKNSRRALSF